MINKRSILLALLLFLICLNAGFLLKLHSASNNNTGQKVINSSRYLSEYDPYIADARQRWSAKNQFSDDAFRNRTTSVITLDDRICVSFEYSQPDIGGLPPFYCYDSNGLKLISKRDGVE